MWEEYKTLVNMRTRILRSLKLFYKTLHVSVWLSYDVQFD